MSDPQPVPIFDTHALIARLRAGEPEAVKEAYRATFGSAVGRLVLADHLSSMGVGRVFGPGMTAGELHYAQGQHDAALDLMNRAGFDPASAAVMVMTGQLEGHEDERSANPNGGHDSVDRYPDDVD